MVVVISWWALGGSYCFLMGSGWLLLFAYLLVASRWLLFLLGGPWIPSNFRLPFDKTLLKFLRNNVILAK